MFEQGLIEEVRNLLNQYGELFAPRLQAVGYREIIKGLKDNHTRNKMIEEVATPPGNSLDDKKHGSDHFLKFNR